MAGAGAEPGAGSSADESTWDGLEIAAEDARGSSVAVRRFDDAGEVKLLVLHRAVNGPDYEGEWAWTSPAGARQPGEAIFAAALRELGEETGIVSDDVWAVDLSARWALFACDVPGDVEVDLVDVEHDRFAWLTADAASSRILPSWVADEQIRRVAAIPDVRLGFRPMTHDDLPAVVDWQRAPHANRWFHGERFDVTAATAKYGPRIEGIAPTRVWVVQVDGRDAGYVQDYRVRDHDEYAVKTQDLEAVAFDYLIGDPDPGEQRGRHPHDLDLHPGRTASRLPRRGTVHRQSGSSERAVPARSRQVWLLPRSVDRRARESRHAGKHRDRLHTRPRQGVRRLTQTSCRHVLIA
jgi:8-oxo-dGTP pyrophosphatase MutT (NUDIX family)